MPCCACTARDLAAGISRGARSSICRCAVTRERRVAALLDDGLETCGIAAWLHPSARRPRGRGPRRRASGSPRRGVRDSYAAEVSALARWRRLASSTSGGVRAWQRLVTDRAAVRSAARFVSRLARRRAGARRPRGPGRPWREASVTDAPMRGRVSLRTAPRHRSVRRRVRTGSTRRGSCPSERRRGAYASSNRLPLFGSAPPVAYRSGSRALRTGIRRTTGTCSLVPAARSACCVPSGSCVEVSPPAGGVFAYGGFAGEPCSYRDRPRAFPRRQRVARAGASGACCRDGGLACNCRGRALDLRSGVGEWRVASVRAAGALNPARAGCPGPLACVPLVAPPASVERRVRLEVVVERISQAWHAGPPVGSHATATRQQAVGLVEPISAGNGGRPVRWRCGSAPICSAIGGAIHKDDRRTKHPAGALSAPSACSPEEALVRRPKRTRNAKIGRGPRMRCGLVSCGREADFRSPVARRWGKRKRRPAVPGRT